MDHLVLGDKIKPFYVQHHGYVLKLFAFLVEGRCFTIDVLLLGRHAAVSESLSTPTTTIIPGHPKRLDVLLVNVKYNFG